MQLSKSGLCLIRTGALSAVSSICSGAQAGICKFFRNVYTIGVTGSSARYDPDRRGSAFAAALTFNKERDCRFSSIVFSIAVLAAVRFDATVELIFPPIFRLFIDVISEPQSYILS